MLQHKITPYLYNIRKLRTTATYQAFTRFCFFTETYEIVYGEYCKENSKLTKREYESLNTLQQAKEYCAEDKECLSIQATGCDGLGTFKLCKNLYNSSTSLTCQHKKLISHGMYNIASTFE